MDTRDKVSAAITALPEKSAYLIFDQGVRDRATAIEFYDQKGYVTTGKTMEELAEKIDLPKEILAKQLMDGIRMLRRKRCSIQPCHSHGNMTYRLRIIMRSKSHQESITRWAV